MEKRLPSSLKNCPITEAIVEFRFTPNVPKEAVLGILFEKLGDEYGSVNNLPIMQLPEIIRDKDINLKYKPYYELEKDPFKIHIGPNVIAFINIEPYKGWKAFYPFIKEVIIKISTSSLIKSVERIGVRYINFFEDDLFGNIELQVKVYNEELSNDSTTIRLEKKIGEHLVIYHFANNIEIELNRELKNGSIIDIDCINKINCTKDEFIENYEKLINHCHDLERESFFELFTEEFLEKFEPIYGDE